MYEPHIVMSMDDAWEMAAMLANCAVGLAERGEPEAQRYYEQALALYAAWFPTTVRYLTTCESFAAYLHAEHQTQAAVPWEKTATALRTRPLTRYVPRRFRRWREAELSVLPLTQRVLLALEASAQGMHDLNAILRRARNPPAQLCRLLHEPYGWMMYSSIPTNEGVLDEHEGQAQLQAQVQEGAATVDTEAVIARYLLRREMEELHADLTLAQSMLLPEQDERAKLPPERRPPTLTRYLATVIAQLLTLLDTGEMPGEAEQRERQEVIASAVTARGIAVRVGAASFPVASAG